MELSNETLISLYKTMKKIRLFEERVSELFAAGKVGGFVHLYIGEEAVASGVSASLRESDYITSTHRGHGHLIGKGGDIKQMMAELFGRSTGYCKGKGGSMHIADVDLGILGANGIVGAGGPIAVGAGFAAKYKDTDDVSVCFFGDGASNQGTTAEAMNMASAWNLPVVFINENNLYGISCCTSKSMRVSDVADKAGAYDIPGIVVDGNDVVAVYEAAAEAIKGARQGKGPALIECKTYRHKGHFEGDPCVYRPEDEVQEWKAKDPVARFEEKLLGMDVLTQEQILEIDAAMQSEIDTAVSFAEESPLPKPEEVTTDVYTV